MSHPYGYRRKPAVWPPKLVADILEQAVIRIVLQLHEEGRGLREIAEELTARGFATRKGTPWHHQLVKRIIDRYA